MANFTLSTDAQKKQADAQTEQDRIKAQQSAREKTAAGQGLATPDELMRHNAAEFSKWDAEAGDQAKRGGVETAAATANAGGIAGFFGGKEQTTHYTAGQVDDQRYLGNRARLGGMAASIDGRPMQTMQGAQIGGVSASDQDQMRMRQNAMLNQLSMQAAGQGPSAAQQMLKIGADRAQAAALSRAAAAGTPGAQRAASFEAAAATQDAAGQSSMLRAQEQQQAMGMLGQYVQGARAQDLGLREQNIGLATGQAGLNQDTAKTNLLASVEQQKQKDALVAQYTAQGISLDQAKHMAELQQAQFNAELLARQAAADKGVAMQSSAQGGQTLGALASAVGTIAASASDERVKENVDSADSDVEKFLDGIDAKSWDYKDPKKHGEGRRTGIMAQAAEKNSSMVFTHPDGTKMIDHGKAIGTSLAALANINKRLRELEK